MDTTLTKKETVVDRLNKFNRFADKWIDFGKHESYDVSYDTYDRNKIEVYFNKNLTSNCFSVIYDDDNGDYFLLHFDDNTGAYYRKYDYDDAEANLLLAHYQSIVQFIASDFFSVHDFIERLDKFGFTYSQY